MSTVNYQLGRARGHRPYQLSIDRELPTLALQLSTMAVLKKVRYARTGLCPMPYALCPVIPHLSEKCYINYQLSTNYRSFLPVSK
ncbi:MAG: hypothetical protein ACRC62_18790 [Microcoleus sp.]